jgi:hypothetical protein
MQKESRLSAAEFCRDNGSHLDDFHACQLQIAEFDAKSSDSNNIVESRKSED